MSGNTTIVQSTPGFVTGTYGAKALRNAVSAWLQNRPGVASSGDFAVSQRGAGANMSVDIAAGGAYIAPAAVTRQGMYYVQYDSTYNTSSNGGYTWTAADATNPRIDLVCLEVKDNAEDASGATGLRFRIVDGTPNASATHQLATTYWPAVPTGCVPIAAIRVPATATTLTTTNITNLNPLAGPVAANNYIAAAESTSSASLTRLTTANGTADFCCVYVPSSTSVVEIAHRSLVSMTAASGTQSFAFFANDTQLKIPVSRSAPIVTSAQITSLGTKYTQMATTGPSGNVTATTGIFSIGADSTTDITFETSPTLMATSGNTTTAIAPGAFTQWTGFTAGWNIVELRYSTSASTLNVKNRSTIVRVL